VEKSLYDYARSLGITIITISQRPGLVGKHTQQLALQGGGSADWQLFELRHHAATDKSMPVN
jgi:ATP-binding cassette subfamily D (ALD) long-chain fatty acid import protein